MRSREFVFEQATVPAPQVDNLKNIIQSKIKELPPTPETKNFLDEIQDIIEKIPLGGTRKNLSGELLTFKDQDVRQNKELLAKYIASLDANFAYKKSMLDKWKTGGLLNVSILIDGRHPINEIVMDYDTNPAIKELADDLIQVSSLGHGKGEFFLCVLSPQITNPGPAGDILVRGLGTVEVKTSAGGSGRFTDRQVKPNANFRSLSQDFIDQFGMYLATNFSSDNTDKKKKIRPLSATGINMDQLITIYQNCDSEDKQSFPTKLRKILNSVFVKSAEYVDPILTAIMSGESGKAKQLYSVGILNNYIGFKEDKGFLFINLNLSPANFVYFTDNANLNALGMRIHAGTIYPVSTNELYPYPQMKLVDTKQAQPSAGG